MHAALKSLHRVVGHPVNLVADLLHEQQIIKLEKQHIRFLTGGCFVVVGTCTSHFVGEHIVNTYALIFIHMFTDGVNACGLTPFIIGPIKKLQLEGKEEMNKIEKGIERKICQFHRIIKF